MPSTNKYLKLTIGGNQVQVSDPEELPISIDYTLEDPENFQSKTSAQALEVKVPATLLNDKAGNTYRNPDILDLTDGSVFRSNQRFILVENGHEILIGKAFLTSASHNGKPQEYTYNLYGDNADWKIDLQEATLYDFIKQITFDFTKLNIIASWAFDGTDEALPYVFAPVRYRQTMGGSYIDSITAETKTNDDNMLPIYMKPSISKYWILYWAFKSLGYKISSNFLDSEYFRRQVMPWTWGSFLGSEGTKLDVHNFLAKSAADTYFNAPDGRSHFFWNLGVSNDSTDGGSDNNNDYLWDDANAAATWTYNPPDFGNLDATFSMQVEFDARLNHRTSDITLNVYWYRTRAGVTEKLFESEIVRITGVVAGGDQKVGIAEIFFTVNVDPGDTVTAKFWLDIKAAVLGFAAINAQVLEFKLDFLKVPLGGTISFVNFTGFQKYKVLDFMKGVLDEFNMSINTDPVNKVVYIEPTHPFSIVDDPSILNDGYFKHDFLDWNGKEDLLQEWIMENYKDYNRELTFKYKNDTNDGILKTVQDRNINTLAAGKYVFPERFKTGKSDIENSFFSPTMHYEVDQWKSLGTGANAGISPQMVCIVPENVSNTSNTEADNTFLPKSCYYKGLVTGVGAWRFDKRVLFGDMGVRQDFPYMFSVNYKIGGENDPILSYSDEKISTGINTFTVGKGLLKRFYWQRLAIMRNGQWYNTWFRLKNVDVSGQLHREYISFKGHRWELIQIKGYKPLSEVSTACLLYKWSPISEEDFNNTFPSEANVLNNAGVNSLDIKYAQLKCLATDIPTL